MLTTYFRQGAREHARSQQLGDLFDYFRDRSASPDANPNPNSSPSPSSPGSSSSPNPNRFFCDSGQLFDLVSLLMLLTAGALRAGVAWGEIPRGEIAHDALGVCQARQ